MITKVCKDCRYFHSHEKKGLYSELGGCHAYQYRLLMKQGEWIFEWPVVLDEGPACGQWKIEED